MLTFSQKKKQQTPEGIVRAQQSDCNAHKNRGCVGGRGGRVDKRRERLRWDGWRTKTKVLSRFFFLFRKKNPRWDEVFFVFFSLMSGWLISAPSDWAITPSTSFLGTRLLSVIADSWEAETERKKQKCSLTVSLPDRVECFVVVWLKTFPSWSLRISFRVSEFWWKCRKASPSHTHLNYHLTRQRAALFLFYFRIWDEWRAA